MIRLRPSGVDEILIKRVRDWYEPGPGVFIASTSTLFTPAQLFTGSTNGAWYDPSDITTLYRDAAGTQPVTAVEQPVGLMLDKSKGLVLGPELVTNGTFDTDTNWTKGTGWSISAGTANLAGTAGTYPTISQNYAYTANSWYRVTFTVSNYAGGVVQFASRPGGQKGPQASANGTYSFYFLASGTDTYFGIQDQNGGAVLSIDNVSVKQFAGNHAFNSSGNSANFPVLSARVNLLTKSEQFDDATAWVKTGPNTATYQGTGSAAVVTANYGVAPDGTNTADRVQLALNGGTTTSDRSGFSQQNISTISGVSYTVVIYVKPLDSTTSTQLLNSKIGLFDSGSPVTSTIVADQNGFYKITRTFTGDGAAHNARVQIWGSDGVNTMDLLIWGADLRVANDALNQPAYQRVNTSTDYDTVGFKPAEVFDGVDDNLIASAGGGSTTAFFWCSAIRVGKVGAVQTLFSDAGTNTGYRVRINASNQLELSAGNGTAYTTVATTATLSIGQRAVLTAWHDGTNLNVQINNGTVHQAAFATATAGTAQFTIGKDNNAASNFFAGRLYEKVYTKDNVPSSAQITSTKTYVANVAGITL